MEQEFLKDIICRLEASGATYAITGSVASNFWGIPRTTHDVDIVILLAVQEVDQIVARFADRYYVSEPMVREAALRYGMFNIIDFSTSLKADFWVRGNDPFNQSMLSRRRRIEFVPGQEGYIGSAEDVLLHKLVWNTITPSERQLADAAGIAAVQAGKLDQAYLRQWAKAQGTEALLEEVLQGKHLKHT